MLDPICGMPVAHDSPFRVGHEGQDVVFCSKYCADAFARDPVRGSVGSTREIGGLRAKSAGRLSLAKRQGPVKLGAANQRPDTRK